MKTATDMLHSDAFDIAAAVKRGEVSAVELLEAELKRIAELNSVVNAFTTVTSERARREAAAVDAQIQAGMDPGVLAGVPYSVKDLFDLEGVVTLAGSKINQSHPPAARDATLVERLRRAGAVCVGATNMGEYAYDFVTNNHHYGATRNPLDLNRSAGGSSGGSAASVAACMCSFSLGTDTNGSVRVPSSFCGIWGLKPTYGHLSRSGSFMFVSSLDTAGVFARSVRDLTLSFDAMSGRDDLDPVCTKNEIAKVSPSLESGITNIRFALLGDYFTRVADESISAAVATVARALSVKRTISLPEVELARAAAFTITAAEGGAFHRQRLATRAEDFDPACRNRFMAGALAPAAWTLQAQRFRYWWREQMQAVFKDVDVLIAPATPLLAPELHQQTFTMHGEEIALRPNIGLLTQPITLVGLPVVAAPVSNPAGLPTAIQLIGKPGSESVLLRTARVLEQLGACSATAIAAEPPTIDSTLAVGENP